VAREIEKKKFKKKLNKRSKYLPRSTAVRMYDDSPWRTVYLGDVPAGESEEPVTNDWQKTRMMV